MKKILIKIPLILFPIILLVVINIYADPANLFSKQEKKIAEYQHNGYNVIIKENFNERKIKKEYIKKMEHPKKIIAVGSSRVMGITNEVVNQTDFFNFGVSGAGVYDLLGMVGLLAQTEMLPEVIIIGVDPWIFNRNNGDTRYKDLQEGIKYFKKDFFYLQSINIEKYKELISPSYFQESMKTIIQRRSRVSTMIEPTLETKGDYRIQRADGGISYPINIREQKDSETIKQAIQYISGTLYQLNHFTEIDNEYREDFELLISYLTNNHVEVIFYLPPYHPIVYQYLSTSSQYQIVDAVESYIKEYAASNNIKVYGSYNPSVTGCTGIDFFDGMHLRIEPKIFLKSCNIQQKKL